LKVIAQRIYMLSNQMHNKARHNSTASCAGLAHSSLACACRRYITKGIYQVWK
jgi:hypothetical protein